MVGSDGKGRSVDARVPVGATAAGGGTLKASFRRQGAHTALDRVYEAGSLRLRQPRGTDCEATLVNTGGGIVGGDRLTVALSVGAGASMTVSSVAAEKIYYSAGATAYLETRLNLAAEARLDWLPQETILFDGARVDRRFTIDLAPSAHLLAAETLIFGRLARGETSIHGWFRDGWRIRRDGRLLFADESRLDGAIGTILDRPAVAGGARAVALILVVAPDAERWLAPARAALEPFRSLGVEGGASVRDGLLVGRLLSRSPEDLRAALIAVLSVLRSQTLPRSWG
jgi:urease accessory protein